MAKTLGLVGSALAILVSLLELRKLVAASLPGPEVDARRLD
jgi:hypothetical protein